MTLQAKVTPPAEEIDPAGRVPSDVWSIIKHYNRIRRKYPDTPMTDLPQKDRQFRRRRASNKVARASRKANRR